MTETTAPPRSEPGPSSPASEARELEVIVVGAGFAGIGAAVKLREQGITDFVVLERGHTVGGTWRDNTYPGCACDVPSNLYSFSFAPNPEWSRSFSPQPEIQDYLERVTDDFGVRAHVRIDHELEGAAWGEPSGRWHLRTSRGTYTARFLVSATGALSEPSLPPIEGLDSFPGTTFHSAAWDHDHDLSGERVAVVGTGASAIQFAPEIVDDIGSMTVFQRTAPWVVPRGDRDLTRAERGLFRRAPALQRLVRAAIYWGREALVVGLTRNPGLMRVGEALSRRQLAAQVSDPELRAKLTPDYTMGCKRILLSNDWYPTLNRDHVEVVTSGVTEVRGSTVVTADGTEREVDTIIFGTGFEVAEPPIAQRIRTRDGRTLTQRWSEGEGAEAYLGTTTVGCPNLFFLVGPNTGLGHTSMVVMMESQFAYLIDALRQVRAHGIDEVEVREPVQRAYADELQDQLAGTVWNAGGCASWYLNANGRNTTLWPDFTFRFRERTRNFDLGDYEVVRWHDPDRAVEAASEAV